MKLSSLLVPCMLLETEWLYKIHFLIFFSGMILLQYSFAYSANSVGKSHLLMSFWSTTWNLSVFASFSSWLSPLSEENVSPLLVVESSDEE